MIELEQRTASDWLTEVVAVVVSVMVIGFVVGLYLGATLAGMECPVREFIQR